MKSHHIKDWTSWETRTNQNSLSSVSKGGSRHLWWNARLHVPSQSIISLSGETSFILQFAQNIYMTGKNRKMFHHNEPSHKKEIIFNDKVWSVMSYDKSWTEKRDTGKHLEFQYLLTCSWETDPSVAMTEPSILPTELRESSWWMASRILSLHFKICFFALWSSFSGLIFSRLWHEFQ